MNLWEVQSSSPEETRALGEALGRVAVAGLVVLLNGDLGAGKTCFAQGIARGLGVPAAAPVTSPTYTLLNVHEGRLPLYHFDLYRLARVDDLADLGYDEVAEGDGLTLVEWGDRMSEALPAALSVSITPLDDERRRLRFEAFDDCGRTLLDSLAAELPPA